MIYGFYLCICILFSLIGWFLWHNFAQASDIRASLKKGKNRAESEADDAHEQISRAGLFPECSGMMVVNRGEGEKIYIFTPAGLEAFFREVDELALRKIMDKKDDCAEFTCNRCSEPIMGSLIPFSIWDMPYAGFGEVHCEYMPYCKNCDVLPTRPRDVTYVIAPVGSYHYKEIEREMFQRGKAAQGALTIVGEVDETGWLSLFETDLLEHMVSLPKKNEELYN